jgi:hypothetical protein
MSTTSPTLRTGTGARLDLGRKLAKGGQGTVFDVASNLHVVLKKYHEDELKKDQDLEERLKLMMRLPPDGSRKDRSGHLLLTWPTDLVYEGSRFVGFLMPRLDTENIAELHRATDPSDRVEATGTTSWLCGFTWLYLVSVAKNLALGTELLHASKVVIGDFNDRNVAVTRDARVTLFDCDSMQITDPESEHRFLCRVRRSEFLAPELLSVDLGTVVRPVSSDLFALAVHLHQLLLEGEHPFRGRWEGAGDQPKESVLATQGLWTHGGFPDIHPRPSAIGIDLLPESLIEMFRAAFVEGALRPGRRPSAEQWRDALDELAASLVQCTTEQSHWYPRFQSQCPWCAHEHKHARSRLQQVALPTLPTTPTAAPRTIPVAPLTTPLVAAATPPLTTVPIPPSRTQQAWRVDLPYAAQRATARVRFILVAIVIAAFYAGSYTFSDQAAQPNGLGEGLLWCGACALTAMIIAGVYDACFGPAPPQSAARDTLLTGLFTAAGLALWGLSFEGPNPSALGWLAPPLLMALGHGTAIAWAGSNAAGPRIRLVAAVAAIAAALACASTILGVRTQQPWLSENPVTDIFESAYEQLVDLVAIAPSNGLNATGAPAAIGTLSPAHKRSTNTTHHSSHRTPKPAKRSSTLPSKANADASAARARAHSSAHASTPTQHPVATSHVSEHQATAPSPSHRRASPESHANVPPSISHAQPPGEIEGHAESAPSGGGGGSSGIQGSASPESSGSSSSSGISGSAG